MTIEKQREMTQNFCVMENPGLILTSKIIEGG